MEAVIHHYILNLGLVVVAVLDDDICNPSGKQLMVLGSTKDNPKVMVSGTGGLKGRP